MPPQDILDDLKTLGLPPDATPIEAQQRYLQILAVFTCNESSSPQLIKLCSTVKENLQKSSSSLFANYSFQTKHKQATTLVVICVAVFTVIALALCNHPNPNSSTDDSTTTTTTTGSDSTTTGTSTEPSTPPAIEKPVIPNPSLIDTTPPAIQSQPVIETPPVIENPPQPPKPDTAPQERELLRLKAHMDSLSNDMRAINQRWGPSYHDVQSLKEQLAQISDQLNNQPRDAYGNVINMPSGHMAYYQAGLSQRYNALSNQYNNLYPTSQSYADGYETDRREYDSSLEQYNQIASQISWEQLTANYPPPLSQQ